MADYWKSQAKKFCDFCKCWIADNKPSVEFHEKGKRHKENVEKRLKEIGQKSRKEHKESIKVDVEMKKMEEAAMKAYLKDIEGGGDFTSQMLRKEKEERIQEQMLKKQEEERLQEEKKKLLELEKKLDKDDKAEEGGSDATSVDVKQENTAHWYEAKSDEGYSYFWHTTTGESVWEAPAEGFVSIAEQAAQEATKLEAEKKLSKEEELAKQRAEKLESAKREREEQEREAERSARRAREKMKSRAVKEKKEVVPFESQFIGPAPRHDPYGGWQTVEKYDETPVDLELPEQYYDEVNVPVIIDTEPKFKIKEKTIGSIDCEGSSDFKKRKLNSSSKRNMRQRLDDE